MKDSRATADCVRRRRECVDCGHRWSTYETALDYDGALEVLSTALHAIRDAVRPALSIRRGTPYSLADVRKRDRRVSQNAYAERRKKIAELYPKIGRDACAERMRMTPNAVRMIARRLKLKQPKGARVSKLYKDEADSCR